MIFNYPPQSGFQTLAFLSIGRLIVSAAVLGPCANNCVTKHNRANNITVCFCIFIVLMLTDWNHYCGHKYNTLYRHKQILFMHKLIISKK